MILVLITFNIETISKVLYFLTFYFNANFDKKKVVRLGKTGCRLTAPAVHAAAAGVILPFSKVLGE